MIAEVAPLFILLNVRSTNSRIVIIFLKPVCVLWRIEYRAVLDSRAMKNYTIVKVGNDYVVRAKEQSVLKVASRRRAAKLVVEAAELLHQPRADDAASASADESSSAPDAPEGS